MQNSASMLLESRQDSTFLVAQSITATRRGLSSSGAENLHKLPATVRLKVRSLNHGWRHEREYRTVCRCKAAARIVQRRLPVLAPSPKIRSGRSTFKSPEEVIGVIWDLMEPTANVGQRRSARRQSLAASQQRPLGKYAR